MDIACRLAGFIGAHALWSVEDGGPLVPMTAFATADGQRAMERYALDDPAAAIDAALDAQRANEGGHPGSVMAHTARLPLPGGDTDAVVLYIVDHAARRRLVLGVPFARKDALVVRTLQVLHSDNVDEGDVPALVEAFFDGVEEHPHGSRLWGEHFRD